MTSQPASVTVKGRMARIIESIDRSRLGQFWISSDDARILNCSGKWEGSYVGMCDDHYWPTREAAQAFLDSHADQPAERCKTCDGLGYIEYDSSLNTRRRPCPDCGTFRQHADQPQRERADVGLELGWSDAEREAIIDLAIRQGLTPAQVMRQALRTYQLVALGHSRLVEVNPIPKQEPQP